MTDEMIRVEDRFYILASAPRADERSRVLKHGETFAVFDQLGDLRPTGLGEEGIYHRGTRHLSHLRLRLDGRRPLLLSSTVRNDNSLLVVDLANPDVDRADRPALPREVVHVFRSAFLWNGACYTRLRLHSYANAAVEIEVSFTFAADFADVFEVRGMKRAERGSPRRAEVGEDAVVLAYGGLDGIERRTRLRFQPPPAELTDERALLRMTLEPRQEVECALAVHCSSSGDGDGDGSDSTYDAARDAAEQELVATRRDEPQILTSNEQFNDWLNRSAADVQLMVTQRPEGPYPYAGIPWFSTVFGRDGIVTALECLWLNASLARGVLCHLAATQAAELDPERDAQPGRILHESREGEMANLGEVPFGRYYGSADATPLFVVLAGAYYARTADRELVEQLWPNVERALAWIDDYADVDGDGLVEYARLSSTGLVSQGWKDSADSVFHADGTLAEPPVALCEVQAYVYAARRAAASLAEALGDAERSRQLTAAAESLQRRFEDAFWCEDLSTYALALDGQKRPCRVRASNAGHCLFAGIARPDRALRTGHTLIEPEFFSGFGIRTVATTEARYNPMSYHNGSVWPHDNALIAYGLARYGMREAAMRVLTGLFDASLFVDLHRMPELFCGFPRRPCEGPTLYPLACAPQSWAAGSVFLLLQACLGLSIDAARRSLRLQRPCLPPCLQTVRIENLRIGQARLDLEVVRHENDVGVNLLRRNGDVEVVIAK